VESLNERIQECDQIVIAALGEEARGARREKRQETGGGGGSAQAGGTAASVVGERGSVRTVAQWPEGDERSGMEEILP